MQDAEERVTVVGAVPPHELRIVEVVARVHANAGREAAAQGALSGGIQEGNLDSVHLLAIEAEYGQAYVCGLRQILNAPVAGEGWVKHVSEPVNDGRSVQAGQHFSIHALVVLSFGCAAVHVTPDHHDTSSSRSPY